MPTPPKPTPYVGFGCFFGLPGMIAVPLIGLGLANARIEAVHAVGPEESVCGLFALSDLIVIPVLGVIGGVGGALLGAALAHWSYRRTG